MMTDKPLSPEELRAKVESLEKSISDSTEINIELRGEIKELKAKVESLEGELMEERSRNIVPYSFNGISEANEEITKLKEENEKLRDDIARWNIEMKRRAND